MAEYWEYQNNKEFAGKVKYEMQVAAIAVMAEAVDVTGHVLRVEYAKKILDGTASVKEMSIGVLTNSTVKTHVINDTDYTSDLAFVVSSMFNAFAGVSN